METVRSGGAADGGEASDRRGGGSGAVEARAACAVDMELVGVVRKCSGGGGRQEAGVLASFDEAAVAHTKGWREASSMAPAAEV